MRIAFVYYDAPGYVAGPLVNARRLLPELVRRGHEVHALIYYRGAHASSTAFMEAAGVRCQAKPFALPTEALIRVMIQQIMDIDPDVFIPNLSVQGWIVARWARESGIPTIAAHRSDDAFHHAMVERFVLGDPAWAVSGLVCVNNRLRGGVERRGPLRTRLCTIPSGVPVPASYSKQQGPLRLAYVGRFEQKAKCVHETLMGVIGALRMIPEASATFLGEGSERAQLLRTIQQEGMDGRILVKGPVPSEAVQEELANHHVIVLLSDYEGTPGALMDGMACGLVPVCLDIPGGVRELVEPEVTGLLVDNRGDAFVGAIRRLATDPALRWTLGSAARRLIEQGFSLSLAADRWEHFCKELLAEAGTRKRLCIPSRLDLPPVHPDLAHEDRREAPNPHKQNVAALHAFTSPKLCARQLDTYAYRAAILRELGRAKPLLEGHLLDLGCGRMPYRELLMMSPTPIIQYTGVDIPSPLYPQAPGVIAWDGRRLPFEAATFGCAMATEVFEHCPDLVATLRELRRVVRPGARLFFTTPFLWPLHDAPNDICRPTPYGLENQLRDAGFRILSLNPLGGWNASLAQVIALWVRRRPMGPGRRRWLSRAALPLVRYLLARDSVAEGFEPGLLFTGVAGVAEAQA